MNSQDASQAFRKGVPRHNRKEETINLKAAA
jgi:hypothetical protein